MIALPPKTHIDLSFSRLLMLALGSFLSIGLTSCGSRPELTTEFRSPDGRQTYTCGEERGSAMGCYTHWCWHFTQENLNDIKKKNGLSWQPCVVSLERSNRLPSDPIAVVNAGGVPWWWWHKGQVGDPVLTGFAVHDYRLVNGTNDTLYGDAIRQRGSNYCYDVNWAGTHWGTFCMVAMKEVSSS